MLDATSEELMQMALATRTGVGIDPLKEFVDINKKAFLYMAPTGMTAVTGAMCGTYAEEGAYKVTMITYALRKRGGHDGPTHIAGARLVHAELDAWLAELCDTLAEEGLPRAASGCALLVAHEGRAQGGHPRVRLAHRAELASTSTLSRNPKSAAKSKTGSPWRT